MKVLWHSNAPWAPTGYGMQTALFTPKLAEHGYEVVISANYGLEAARLVWDGVPVLPGLGGSHGNETLPGHVKALFGNPRDGLVFTLYDTPVFDSELFKHLNCACWVPVDHDPLVPASLGFFRGSQAIPVAMSRFGQQQLDEFDPLYVPHGIPEEFFGATPQPSVRELMGIMHDAPLITICAANKGRPSRKSFQHMFEAFAEFQRKNEDATLYVHTTMDPAFANGEDLGALAAAVGIPQERFRFPDQYSMMFSPMQQDLLAQILASSDVLLNTSQGEGFGVPIVEAAAAGTPAIVTDHSAMPEVAGPAGWKVKGRRFWTGQSSWMAVPDVGEIIDALDECFGESSEKRKKRSEQAREHARQYEATTVFEEHMLPAFEAIQERLEARKPFEVAA